MQTMATASLIYRCGIHTLCHVSEEYCFMMTSWHGHPLRITAITWSDMNRYCNKNKATWWRHEMGTFSPVPGEFPSQRPVTQNFDVFFDRRLNKRLSKHSRRRWFETPSRSLWRHSNENTIKSTCKFDVTYITGRVEETRNLTVSWLRFSVNGQLLLKPNTVFEHSITLLEKCINSSFGFTWPVIMDWVINGLITKTPGNLNSLFISLDLDKIEKNVTAPHHHLNRCWIIGRWTQRNIRIFSRIFVCKCRVNNASVDFFCDISLA